jgi:hypothetical protein
MLDIVVEKKIWILLDRVGEIGSLVSKLFMNTDSYFVA